MRINIHQSSTDKFENRHNGPDAHEVQLMLERIGASSLDNLIEETIPNAIRLERPLRLPDAKSEHSFLKDFKKLMQKNKLFKSYIGLGYYDCIVPGVIQRNILENPGWYTAYTPYQAEIAQGRLEALVNFQTMVTDLTGMEIANASLLDEGTAAAEAMNMLAAIRKGAKKKSNTFFVDENTFPQTIDVIQERAHPIGINIVVGDLNTLDLESQEDVYGILVQYPNANGGIKDYKPLITKAHEKEISVAMAADLLSLTLLTPPGEMGADVVVGTTQRFGVPMGYGGPHAAYFATKEAFKRQIPGRIIGVSVDAQGKPGYRMALQTREQHIRRDKATSNICTAQVLLAVMAGMYAVYHGPEKLKSMALRIHGLTQLLAQSLGELGYIQTNKHYFDTLKIAVSSKEKIRQLAEVAEVNFRYFEEEAVGISFDETTTYEDVVQVLQIFAEAKGTQVDKSLLQDKKNDLGLNWPSPLVRTSAYLTHPVFNTHYSEHEMLRYIKQLENKDLSLVHSMISLGSCTMKLNATTEMVPVTWPELNLHPFVPANQAQGYREMFTHLEQWLNEITGFAATSLQPNSGAQGEYAGLLVIKAYHESQNEGHRNVALIPTSAHGTNFASAVMAGMKVVLVNCDEKGNIDLEDLSAKAHAHKDDLSCLMVTYPSTHGVFETEIREICAAIHENGGQVYMDGANMNAQVGLTSPAQIGADVCHLNLHKTFCIPHGGGGPGMGPICVAAHLAPFLPGNPLVPIGGEQAIGPISSAPWGSASILAISYAYIAMMGGEGLTHATQMAILNANYIKARLKGHFEVLYTGKNGRSAHEMIIDCRVFKPLGIEVSDIAKRLMDYGFHAPTISFPVPGTMMIEPTESEALTELDKFCDALLQIRQEIREIEEGVAEKENNVLKNAPHTAEVVTSDHWSYAYTREKAAYPLPSLKLNKFWPAVSRIDDAYGDRNLMCSCLPMEAYEEEKSIIVDAN